jgi:alanine racemase
MSHNKLEIFHGYNDNIIISDLYKLSVRNITKSLQFQKNISYNKPKILILVDEVLNDQIIDVVSKFNPDIFLQLSSHDKINIDIKSSTVLVRGTKTSKILKQLKLKTHNTYIEIDLNAIANNIKMFKSLIPNKCEIISVIKAESYGVGTKTFAHFLQMFGIDKFAVGCIDEGIELRNCQIDKPIMVMNPDFDNLDCCLDWNLEPTIYSKKSLNKLLQLNPKYKFPIHLKVQTGMNRLGFNIDELDWLIDKLKNSNLFVKSVYSHLVDTDNYEYTEYQISNFDKHYQKLSKELGYKPLRHILNTEGIISYPQWSFELVRLGLGIWGNLKESQHKSKSSKAIKWFSKISQIREVEIGESVGYDRYFTATKKTKIAIIPVGYADGFKRNLSDGIGQVYIANEKCSIIGRVCMDMIMVDITDKLINEGDLVEIIGKNQTAEQLADCLGTIVDELFTGISQRVNRVFIWQF